jgi:SAM-dependent methyltransferase
MNIEYSTECSDMSIYNTLHIYTRDGKFHFKCDRNRYLQQKVKGKTVLHVGCSDFPITQQRLTQNTLLHHRLQESAKGLIGIDLSEEGISILQTHGFANVFIMDAENITLSTKFDVILAGDVLEHLNNPGLFLDKVRSLLNPDGEIVIGVPSALTINNVKAWFLGREQVHGDHTFYFSPKTLSSLCARYDLLPTELVFTVQPPGPSESAPFLFFRMAFLNCFRSMAPSIIMHFKKAEDVDKGICLEWK